MRKYFGQFGEDYLLWKIFKNQSTGFYVEIGGLDGIRFSNTYSFEQEGWSGVCIEPHPDYFPLLKRNRPRSYCVEAAAGKTCGFIDFYAEPHGEFSTTVTEVAANINHNKIIAGFQKVTVPVISLDQVLSGIQLPKHIDFISIDVEGAELDVLEGFTISKYSPRVFVIEANNAEMDRAIDAIMKAHGYYKAGRLCKTNNIYCKFLPDAIKIALTPIECEVIVTRHPLNFQPGKDEDTHISQIKQPSMFLFGLINLFSRVSKRIKNKLL